MSTRFLNAFYSFSKQWAFNRTISFRVKLQRDIDNGIMLMLFEFSNVNTFVSARTLRGWFEDIIIKHNVLRTQFINDLMRFVSGSYHFIVSPKPSPKWFSATAFIMDLDLDAQSLINPNIDGVPIKLSKRSRSVNSEHLHNQNTVKCIH